MNDQPNGHDQPSLFEAWLRAYQDANYLEAHRLRLELMARAAKPPKEENPFTIERPPRSPGAGVRKSRGRRI
jgi:hypothetical protein